MALLFERTQKYCRKQLDTADIVRDVDVTTSAINQSPIEHSGSFDSERIRKPIMLAPTVVPVENSILRVVADTRHDGTNKRESSHVREAFVGKVDLH